MLPFVGGGGSDGASMKKILSYLSVTQKDLLERILTELKVNTTFLKDGLNIPSEVKDIREDVQNEAEE